jgi:hypothetical protein
VRGTPSFLELYDKEKHTSSICPEGSNRGASQFDRSELSKSRALSGEERSFVCSYQLIMVRCWY